MVIFVGLLKLSILVCILFPVVD